MANYEIKIYTDKGVPLGNLTGRVTQFEYTKIVNGVGYWSLTAPANEFPDNERYLDYQYHFWRNGKRDFIGLRRDVRKQTRGGNTTITLMGFDANDLLRRRVVDAYVGSTGGEKTDCLDDMMKAIVTEQLATGTTGRNIGNRINFSVAPDLSLAPSTTRSFAYENVFEVLQALAACSAGQSADPVPLFFGIADNGDDANGKPKFQFRTWINQPGVNRTSTGLTTGARAVVFSLENGNLDNIVYELHHSDDYNYVIAGGLGLEDDANMQRAYDQSRIDDSALNLKEIFVSGTHETEAGVSQIAYEELNAKRPTRTLRATLLDTDDTPYQTAWNCGDKVTVKYGDRSFDEIIYTVTVRVDGGGKETITGQFDYGVFTDAPEMPILRKQKVLEKELKRLQIAVGQMAKYTGTGSSVPTTTELPREGMYYLFDNGIVRRAYYNVGGTIRNVTLT